METTMGFHTSRRAAVRHLHHYVLIALAVVTVFGIVMSGLVR